MKVSIFQTDIIYGAPAWNLDKVSRWIEGLPQGTDLAILPELFDTGTYKVKSDSTINLMTELAIRLNIAICFTSYIDHFNKFCFIHPDGKLDSYNKRHLFHVCNENKYINRGQEKIIINYKGYRILPEICYDLRFPVWSYNTKQDEYDLIIYPAAWPEKRIDQWEILLKARAIENNCYVIGVNRVGDDANNHFPGASMVIDQYGKIIARADNDLECTISITFNDFQRKFCNFADSEKFIINA